MPGFEVFGQDERESVAQVLETGVLMRYGFENARRGHWKASEFESALGYRLGVRHVHVCSSGTAALYSALAACGIGAGDEVIVPPFTFVATVEAVLQAGAVPVFADIDATLGLDPNAVAGRISERTKAIIVVHMCGGMARIDELARLADRHGIVLVEDVAQAIGATFKGRSLGTFGSAGCFSFDYVKTITCGEGGAVVTDDGEIHRHVCAYADHGHDHLGPDRGADGHEIMGTNFRISELHAAVGLAQLAKLDEIIDTQRRHKRQLVEALSSLERVELRPLPDPRGDSATFVSFALPSRARAREAAQRLGAAGVDGCFYWYENNWHYHRQWDHLKRLASPARLAGEAYGYATGWARGELVQSDDIIGRTISMAVKLSWTEQALAERIDKMRAVLA